MPYSQAKHIAPATHADVPDDTAVRLVVVPPRFLHQAGSDDSAALTWSRDVLDHRAKPPSPEPKHARIPII